MANTKGMWNIIKAMAGGIKEGLPNKISNAEAKRYAKDLYKSMDNKVVKAIEKDSSKLGEIISSDIKNVGSENIEHYLKNTVINTEKGFSSVLGDVTEKANVTEAVERLGGTNFFEQLSGLDKKFFNEKDVEETVKSLSSNKNFISREVSEQTDIIRGAMYNNKAASDPVFAKHYEAYQNTQNIVKNNLRYNVDNDTLKEVYGNKIKLAESNSAKDFKNADANARIESIINNSNGIDDMFYNAYNSETNRSINNAANRLSDSSQNTIDKAINKRVNSQSFEEYVTNKYDDKVNKTIEQYNNASPEQLAKMQGKYGKEGDMEENIKNYYNKEKESGGAFGIGDKAAYYKAPQKALGIGATAWLVSNMCSTKGQMENSQLYSPQQQGPYGNRGY